MALQQRSILKSQLLSHVVYEFSKVGFSAMLYSKLSSIVMLNSNWRTLERICILGMSAGVGAALEQCFILKSLPDRYFT